MAQPQHLDEPERLVGQHHPRLFDIEVLHTGMHLAIDGVGAVHARAFLGPRHLSATAHFTGGLNGHRLGQSHALVSLQLGKREFAQLVEIVATVGQYLLHQVYSALLGSARPDEDGQQLGIAQRRRSQAGQLLTRTVFLCPLVDTQTAGGHL